MPKSFEQLREQYKTFTYEGFSIDVKDDIASIRYDFTLDSLCEFHPEWTVPVPAGGADFSSPAVRQLLFSLGMTEAVSYWKAACPQTFIVKAGYLDGEQIAWWKKLYWGGLGEFFYQNQIRSGFDDFITIQCEANEASKAGPVAEMNLEGCLIPVGGGKDSIVTAELLRHYPDRRAVFMINPKRAQMETSKIAGFDDTNAVLFSRTLDRKLLELNRDGFLNGHTPFSAIVAFSSALAACLYGYKYIVLSNESSANEATVGDTVNHQYSKSMEFEADFRWYLETYIPCGVSYFSLMRPFAEIQIARCFAKHDEYFDAFLSCNLGSKTDTWCTKCPKCLFIYLMLLPFIPSQRLISIFGRDMAEDTACIADFEKLLGVVPEKPFECVGSRQEVRLAAFLAVRRFRGEGKPLPLLLRHYEELVLPVPEEHMLTEFGTHHFIPQEFVPYLEEMTHFEEN